jgi:GTP-binding protein
LTFNLIGSPQPGRKGLKMRTKREDVRNIAIIAHVDHGKTTLVDQLLKQSGTFRANQEVAERVMDSNDIERERGITILSKNTAINYNGTKINIIDTPGHADFGGEVERVLKMVNGVVLVVDAYEGVMPQTKFVLQKALELDLSVIVCINKIDRPEARPQEVIDEILELFIDLDANDDQLDCPFVFASAKSGFAVLDLDDERKDMTPLFETIINSIPAPEGDPDAPTQVLISTIDYNDYVGRIGVGKVDNGSIKVNQEVMLVNHHDPDFRKRVKINKLYEFEGLNKVEVNEAKIGSIVAISGIPDIRIGDTICSVDNPEAIPFQKISEPTLSMDFMVNDSPLAGQEGKFVTSRHIRDRLFRELNTDVSLRVEENEGMDSFKVSGRGELHLSVLIENMRREGFEFAVSKAEVLYHYDERGRKLEPIELAYVDVPEEFSGSVIQKLSQRKGELLGMTPINGGYTRLQFSIPSRGLIGYRGEFMTDTKGNGILNTSFEGYEEYKGDIQYRKQGSLIAYESGEAITYGLFNAQERGQLFIGPGEKVYAGMIVGENPRAEDIEVNVCKTKHLTNTRSSSSDEALRLVPPKILSLEQALDYIDTDELLEVTPKSLRIRKKILDSTQRYRANRK